jgi:hypothetical protein
MTWIDRIATDGQHAIRLQTDLEYFAQHALKIRPKAGPLEPFLFNAAQRKLHELIEQQRKKTGRVRVVVLKVRQLALRGKNAPVSGFGSPIRYPKNTGFI